MVQVLEGAGFGVNEETVTQTGYVSRSTGWLPSSGCLDRSMTASTRLCENPSYSAHSGAFRENPPTLGNSV